MTKEVSPIFFFKEDPFINITDGSDDKTLRTVTNKQDSIMQSHTSETLTLTHHSKDWSDYTPQMLKSTPSKSLRMKVALHFGVALDGLVVHVTAPCAVWDARPARGLHRRRMICSIWLPPPAVPTRRTRSTAQPCHESKMPHPDIRCSGIIPWLPKRAITQLPTHLVTVSPASTSLIHCTTPGSQIIHLPSLSYSYLGQSVGSSCQAILPLSRLSPVGNVYSFRKLETQPQEKNFSLIEDIPSGDESDINDESENEDGNEMNQTFDINAMDIDFLADDMPVEQDWDSEDEAPLTQIQAVLIREMRLRGLTIFYIQTMFKGKLSPLTQGLT
ncbi:hypothetical protein GEV33_008542 [Tenebrio molitor]|uniref:Uncharacterized protein n=1 Tax=Tenebrio molitor TaxID=7067 RepID=A0A8J6HGJ8_TENMO|nr:hypothetical protein GEV33_008542 [Tenebrio molitor]